MNDEYINTRETTKILNITPATLRSWAEKDKIRTIRTPSNQRMYHKQDVYDIVGWNPVIKEKTKIIYARVSSKKQMDDLGRQTDFLRSKFPDHELVTDIGSGINWKRKGLKTILERCLSGDVSEVVVAHRDRLCRFAFELIDFILLQSGVKLLVYNEETEKSSDQELAEDLLSIIHVYSCRNMGRRRYSKQKNTDLSNPKPTDTNEEVDGDDEVCV